MTNPDHCSDTMHTTSSSFGIVFDIDGVLMRDGSPISHATDALKLLHCPDTNLPKYPYVFVTNNGGFSELEKAKKISKVLDFEIEEDRLMVAHTPIKELVDLNLNNDVLLISRTHNTSVKLANVYGFKHFTTFQEYMERRPYLYPAKYSTFWTTGVKSEYKIVDDKHDQLPYKSIILFEEPNDWGEAIQVICDILQSKDGLLKKDYINKSDKQEIGLHVANPDFTYGGEFVLPRFTMGAFVECLSKLYQMTTKNELNVTFYGKPLEITYNYAKQLLTTQSKKLNQGLPKRVYAIGDNLYSDIKGANNLEHEGWYSILVKTGVYKGTENDTTIPAKYFCNDVMEAVQHILKLEQQNK
eukprot:gene5520-6878_t